MRGRAGFPRVLPAQAPEGAERMGWSLETKGLRERLWGNPHIPFLLSEGALSPGTRAPLQAQGRPENPPVTQSSKFHGPPCSSGAHLLGMKKTVSGLLTPGALFLGPALTGSCTCTLRAGASMGLDCPGSPPLSAPLTWAWRAGVQGRRGSKKQAKWPRGLGCHLPPAGCVARGTYL